MTTVILIHCRILVYVTNYYLVDLVNYYFVYKPILKYQDSRHIWKEIQEIIMQFFSLPLNNHRENKPVARPWLSYIKGYFDINL